MRHVSTAAQKHTQRGFTLLELMIVVAIAAIIAAVAVPSYRSHVIRTNRASAESFMSQIASKQEQIMLDMRSYQAVANNAAFGNTPAAGGISLAVPTNVANNYTLTVTATVGPPPGYVITATPNNTTQVDLLCQVLTLDNTGNKNIAANAGVAPTSTAQACWQ